MHVSNSNIVQFKLQKDIEHILEPRTKKYIFKLLTI